MVSLFGYWIPMGLCFLYIYLLRKNEIKKNNSKLTILKLVLIFLSSLLPVFNFIFALLWTKEYAIDKLKKHFDSDSFFIDDLSDRAFDFLSKPVFSKDKTEK